MQSGPEPTLPEEAPSEAELEQAEVEVEAEVIEGDAVTSEAAAVGAEAEVEVEAEPDYKDQWIRSVAELDNVRKRARRDAAQAEQRGVARLARSCCRRLTISTARSKPPRPTRRAPTQS